VLSLIRRVLLHVFACLVGWPAVLWEVSGSCANVNVLKGHKNAVIDICWSPSGDRIVSASADKTVSIWEPCPGRRVRKLEGHTKVVNSVAVHGKTIVSGSDDAQSLLWDVRSRRHFCGMVSASPCARLTLPAPAQPCPVAMPLPRTASTKLESSRSRLASMESSLPGIFESKRCAWVRPSLSPMHLTKKDT
jgi:WD40 repeat protein